MKKSLILLTTLSFLFISSTLVHAATATPSATPSANPTNSASPSATEMIQEKIKTLVKERNDATESDLREKINQHVLVGYVGNIQQINSDNISLDTKEDSLLQVTTDEKTEFVKNSAPIKFSSLALSDKLIVIGTLLKDDIVLAKRIVVVEVDPDQIVSGTIVAKISSLDTKKKTIGLTTPNGEIVYALTKKSTIKISDLKEGDMLFAITKKYQSKDYLSLAKVVN